VGPRRTGFGTGGDRWDHVALGPDHRLVPEVVVGKRLAGNAVFLLEGVRGRLGGRVPELLSSDEYPAYPEALLDVFGAEQVPSRTGKPGRPAGPRVVSPAGMAYGTAHKARAKRLLPAVCAELRRLAEALSGRSG
jgi:hypothetical protein